MKEGKGLVYEGVLVRFYFSTLILLKPRIIQHLSRFFSGPQIPTYLPFPPSQTQLTNKLELTFLIKYLYNQILSPLLDHVFVNNADFGRKASLSKEDRPCFWLELENGEI